MFGDEPHRPYERPPLSKEFLWDSSKLPGAFELQDPAFYSKNDIELCVEQRVTRLDLARRGVVLSSGARMDAGAILLCTGGRPRRLQVNGLQLGGIYYLRTAADALALRPRLSPGARVLIVGMGVIGAEIAASARRLGCDVTAVEPMPAPMARLLGGHYGAWLAEKHRQNGVNLQLCTTIDRFEGRGNEVEFALTGDGRTIPTDLVVVGVGMEPEAEIAAEAGIAVEQGIIVDRQCRTSVPGVWAAGDVTRQPDFFEPHLSTRVETFQNAQDQAAAAADSILGRPVDYLRPPWFWSDQYDLNIQVCGRLEWQGANRVIRGDETADSFVAFSVRDGTVQGALAVNRPADMAVARRIVERRIQVRAEALCDETVPLRTLLRAAS